MEPLSAEFNRALQRIEVSGTKQDRAAQAHIEVRELLEGSEQLTRWGVDTVLIGSYARHTGIYPGNDVDVFTKLTRLTTDASPTEVFTAVCDLLIEQYGDRATPRQRSVKIAFAADGFSVDVVPAVRSDQRWAIPNRDRTAWDQPHGRWIDTDPERLTALTIERNREPQVAGRGAYVPTVKLIRQARAHHLADAKPGGLYFELATYWVFEDGVEGDTFAELFAHALRGVAGHLGGSQPLIDPAMHAPIRPAPDSKDRELAATVFADLAGHAEEALSLERCPAAAKWRRVLGTNDRGRVFPLPEGCDELGRTVPPVIPNVETGDDEARGFGR